MKTRKLLLIGHSWADHFGRVMQIPKFHKFDIDVYSAPDLKLSKIREALPGAMKPDHDAVMLFAFLPDLLVSTQMEDNSLPIYWPNTNLVLSEYYQSINEFAGDCLKINPSSILFVVIPPPIDIYDYNVNYMLNEGIVMSDIVEMCPEFMCSENIGKCADASRQLEKHFFRSVEQSQNNKFIILNSKLVYTYMGKESGFDQFLNGESDKINIPDVLYDGYHPNEKFISAFWDKFAFHIHLKINNIIRNSPVTNRDPTESEMSQMDIDGNTPRYITQSTVLDNLQVVSNMLLVGHSWATHFGNIPDKSLAQDISITVHSSPEMKLSEIKTILAERFTREFEAVMIFPFIYDIWKKVPVPNTETSVLIPNSEFSLETYMEEVNDIIRQCWDKNPSAKFFLVVPPAMDIFLYNKFCAEKTGCSVDIIMQNFPDLTCEMCAEHSRLVHKSHTNLPNRIEDERFSFLPSQFVLMSSTGNARKAAANFIKGETNQLDIPDILYDGIHPTEDFIVLFWKKFSNRFPKKTVIDLTKDSCPPIDSSYKTKTELIPPKKKKQKKISEAALMNYSFGNHYLPEPSNQRWYHPHRMETTPEQNGKSISDSKLPKNFQSNSKGKITSTQGDNTKSILKVPQHKSFKFIDQDNFQNINIKILILGHTWAEQFGKVPNIASNYGYEIKTFSTPTMSLSEMRINLPVDHIKSHDAIMIFPFIYDVWKPIPYFGSSSILLPNPHFCFEEYMAELGELTKECWSLNPSLKFFCVVPTVIDTYQYNVSCLGSVGLDMSELIAHYPQLSKKQSSAFCRQIWQSFEHINDIPNDDRFNLIKCHSLYFHLSSRKVVTDYCEGVVDHLNMPYYLKNGFEPTEKFIQLFWKKKKYLIDTVCTNCRSTDFIETSMPQPSEFPSHMEVTPSFPENQSIHWDVPQKLMNLDLDPPPNYPPLLQHEKHISVPTQEPILQGNVLLLGDTWAEHFSQNLNLASEYGLNVDAHSCPNATIDVVHKKIADVLKPHHNIVVLCCLLSEVCMTVPLLQGGPCPQVLVPNPQFSVSKLVISMTSFTITCKAHNPNVKIYLFCLPPIDLYTFNLQNIEGAHPQFIRVLQNDPDFSIENMARSSRKVNNNVSILESLDVTWTDKNLLIGQDILRLTCEDWLSVESFMFGRSDRFPPLLGLPDGIHPSKTFIEAFWHTFHHLFKVAAISDPAKSIRRPGHFEDLRSTIKSGGKKRGIAELEPLQNNSNLYGRPGSSIDLQRRAFYKQEMDILLSKLVGWESAHKSNFSIAEVTRVMTFFFEKPSQ